MNFKEEDFKLAHNCIRTHFSFNSTFAVICLLGFLLICILCFNSLLAFTRKETKKDLEMQIGVGIDPIIEMREDIIDIKKHVLDVKGDIIKIKDPIIVMKKDVDEIKQPIKEMKRDIEEIKSLLRKE
jgi:peptidoglycan hydrolase CwlO-like protein